MSWSVVCFIVWVQSGFGGWCAFCVSAGFCWLVQVWKCAVGERCVDLETQKEGKKSTPKGREAEVTSQCEKDCTRTMQECFVLNAS